MCSVLVVEDDCDLAESVGDLLELRGLRSMHAEHGRGALDLLAKHRFDAILLDMRMPVMDGWQFAAIYRQEFEKRAPIIVMTAAQDAEQRARDVGAVAWIGKPFDSAELFQALEAVGCPGEHGPN
jgi:CheY-like chemotaxis protein